MCMKMTMKDIVSINKEYDEGIVINEGSMLFALESIKKSQDWTEQVSYLVRALLVDHVFKDGNKRTATHLIVSMLEFHPENIQKLVIGVSKDNVSDIKEIKKRITLEIY